MNCFTQQIGLNWLITSTQVCIEINAHGLVDRSSVCSFSCMMFMAAGMVEMHLSHTYSDSCWSEQLRKSKEDDSMW